MAEKVDRLTRVNELLKRELAEAIERGLISAPGVLVSVTEVHASVDLRNATVYISIFGADSARKHKIMRELNEQRLDFQHRLARVLAFKHTPVLDFRLDMRTELGDRVLELLNEEDSNRDALALHSRRRGGETRGGGTDFDPHPCKTGWRRGRFRPRHAEVSARYGQTG